MSVETTYSHNNDMVPLEGETADKGLQFTIIPPVLLINDSTGDTKTFHKFGDLPAELQLKIFKHAMPASRVAPWKQDVPWQLSNTPSSMFNLQEFPELFSLLTSCFVSNESVHHDEGFVKIKSGYGKGNVPP